MKKLLEKFRKLYDELEELKSYAHWKDWADSLAEEVAQLEERVQELETELDVALEAHKRQFEDSDYCYMCGCHEHTDNCPAFEGN